MQSTILASLAISTAAVLAFACGSPPEPKPPTDTGDAGSTSSSSGASSSGASSSGASSGGSSGSSSSSDAGSSTTASSGGSTSGGSTPPAGGGWATLSTDKKTEVMMTKVVPNVGKLFKAHDAKKYDKFGCKTCHGDAKTKSKDNPKKTLPKLKMSGGGMEKLQKDKAAMFKFMSEQVVPAMADALGEKPFDPATKQGFGCGGCHTVE